MAKIRVFTDQKNPAISVIPSSVCMQGEIETCSEDDPVQSNGFPRLSCTLIWTLHVFAPAWEGPRWRKSKCFRSMVSGTFRPRFAVQRNVSLAALAHFNMNFVRARWSGRAQDGENQGVSDQWISGHFCRFVFSLPAWRDRNMFQTRSSPKQCITLGLCTF